MDRSQSFVGPIDLGNRVSFYIDESMQSVCSYDGVPPQGRGRRRPGGGGLRRQASAEPGRRTSCGASNKRLRRHVSDAAAMERPPLSRAGSVGGRSPGLRGKRISRHESDTRRPSRNRSVSGRTSGVGGGSARGSVYQISPQWVEPKRQNSQRASVKSRAEEGRLVKSKQSEVTDPEALAEEEKAMAKERRHRMAVTIILATFFFLVVSSVLVVVVTLTQTTFHNAPAPSNRTYGQQQSLNSLWVRKESEQMMNSLNRAGNNVLATEDNIVATETNLGVSDSASVTINASILGTEETSSSTKSTP